MANRRVLVKRRKAAVNIHKITRTMQLIATARFQTAHKRAVASQPYTRKLTELVADLAGATRALDHPLMRPPSEPGPEVLMVLTSNRGLCGGYNANVLRAAMGHLRAREAEELETEVHMVGKKGISYFHFLSRDPDEKITQIGDRPRFDDIEPLANALIDRFSRSEITSARVAYMRFHSPGKQTPELIQLLPLSADMAPAGAGKTAQGVEYEFSPAPDELLDELLPATVRVRLFQCFIDATVSEQVARMVAMKAATDAADDMIKRLTQQYNRARQTQITMELLDIVGGASALG